MNTEFSKNEKKNDKLNLPMDYAIRSNSVRVVMDNGETNIMSRDDAVRMAKEMGKNLVQIAFNKSEYPGSICKIIDYSKFKYDQKKKMKEQAKKARAAKQVLKEISFSIRIDDADKARNIEHIRQFLDDGNKVLISVVLARREMDKTALATRLIKEVVMSFDGFAEFDSPPQAEGRKISCVLRKIRK